MSSIGVGSSSGPDWSQYGVDPEGGFGAVATGDGNYQLVDDADGPEGPAAPVQGAVVDEATLNQLLAASGAGFQFVNGVRVESDGVDLVSGTGGTIDYSEHPLPSVDGSFPNGGEKADWLMSFEGASDACLMWMGLMTLAKSGREDAKLAKELKNQAHDSKRAAKESEIEATVEKVEAEKDAALQQMVVACCVAAGTAIAAGIGTAGGGGVQGASTAVSVASACGQAVTATSNWMSKEWGPQAEADEKMIEAMRHQARQEMFDSVIEDKKADYEEGKEQFKAALKLIDDHYDMQLQTSGRIFG